MIVFDLEWNRGYDKTPLDEILQIGAVRLGRPGGPIVDSFCAFIRPRVHKRLNRTAKELPEIREALDSPLDFPAAYRQFLRWCGDETEFAAWGCDELDTLRKNSDYWHLPALKTQAVYDLQTAFSLTLGTTQNLGLGWAVSYCQLPECFTYHNALNDAMYTALIIPWIDSELLELAANPHWMLRYLLNPYPAGDSRSVGPFPTLTAALNNRDSRKGSCPVCGQRIWIQSWDYHRQQTYYTDLRCPGHGHSICRLTVAADQDGQWRGNLCVPAPTPALLEEYGRARQGTHYLCKGSAKGRRRHRKRRKETKHE